MANGLLDPTWAPDLADLVKRQQLREAAEKRKALSGGTTRLRQPTATPVEDAFPINPAYTTAASEYLTPSLPGAPNTGVVVSPLAQDPRFVERYPERAKRLLLGDEIRSMTANAVAEKRSETPGDSFKIGFNAGQELAEPQNQRNFLSSLLGSVDWQGLLKVFARPEFLQSGISPAQAFVNSAFAQRQAEAGAAAEQQKQMLELQKEVIKKSGTDAQKLTGPVVDVVNNTATASEGLEAINQYRKILSEAQVGGIGAKLDETVNSVASLFGFGGLTPAQKSQAIRQRVLASLQTAQAKGQISQADYANIEQQLSQPGKWFTNSEALNEQLSLIQSQLQSKLNLGRNTLKYFGLDPAQLSPYSNTPLFSSKRPG